MKQNIALLLSFAALAVTAQPAPEARFAALSENEARAFEIETLERIADLALIPPKLNADPLPQYDYDQLDYGMTIGIARTPGGRIWACWVAGEDGPKAFFVLNRSDDDGENWSKPCLVIDTHDPNRLPLPRSTLVGNLWSDPKGKLHLFFSQSMTQFDGRAGVWEAVCENSDADQPTWPDQAVKTDIPNPGSKATLYSLGGNAVALVHTPDPKHRSPLALWLSFDGMRTWSYRRTLVAESVDGPQGNLNYPEGFVDKDRQWLHIVFDNNRHQACYIAAKLPPLPHPKEALGPYRQTTPTKNALLERSERAIPSKERSTSNAERSTLKFLSALRVERWTLSVSVGLRAPTALGSIRFFRSSLFLIRFFLGAIQFQLNRTAPPQPQVQVFPLCLAPPNR